MVIGHKHNTLLSQSRHSEKVTVDDVKAAALVGWVAMKGEKSSSTSSGSGSAWSKPLTETRPGLMWEELGGKKKGERGGVAETSDGGFCSAESAIVVAISDGSIDRPGRAQGKHWSTDGASMPMQPPRRLSYHSGCVYFRSALLLVSIYPFIPLARVSSGEAKAWASGDLAALLERLTQVKRHVHATGRSIRFAVSKSSIRGHCPPCY